MSVNGINRRQALGVLAAGTAAALAPLAAAAPALAAEPPCGLTWAPPQLTNPVTVKLGTGFTHSTLDVNTDYIVKLPPTVKTGATIITGGRNVVIIGGHIRLPDYVLGESDSLARALFIQGNTGVVHIEGVLIDTSENGLGDALAIQARDSIVQVQNCRFVDLKGDFDNFHADVIQPWGGVKELRVDRFTASSAYQGLFVVQDLAPVGRVIVKRTNLIALPEIHPDAKGGYMWWMGSQPTYELSQVYVQPRDGRPLGMSVWPDVTNATNPVSVVQGRAIWRTMANVTGNISEGPPPLGDFVPEGVAGTGYCGDCA